MESRRLLFFVSELNHPNGFLDPEEAESDSTKAEDDKSETLPYPIFVSTIPSSLFEKTAARVVSGRGSSWSEIS